MLSDVCARMGKVKQLKYSTRVCCKTAPPPWVCRKTMPRMMMYKSLIGAYITDFWHLVCRLELILNLILKLIPFFVFIIFDVVIWWDMGENLKKIRRNLGLILSADFNIVLVVAENVRLGIYCMFRGAEKRNLDKVLDLLKFHIPCGVGEKF